MIFKSYLIEKNISDLKKKIILFYGENLGLKNFFKNEIKDKNKNCDVISIHQDKIIKEKNFLMSEIKNVSLFEKKKIFLIDQASDKIFQAIEETLPFIENQSLFLFSEILERKSKIRNMIEKSSDCAAIACYPDNELGIKKIIQNELKGFEGLSPQIINIIAESTNMDRATLNNEIQKIKLFFINKKINREKLEILLNITVNEDFNTLKDQALIGNKTSINKLLSDTLFDNEKTILYLNIINQRVNRIYEVKKTGNSNIETKINDLKPPIFWKDKPNFTIQTKKWSLEKLKKLQTMSFDLELRIKSNYSADKNLLMKKFILDICQLANSS